MPEVLSESGRYKLVLNDVCASWSSRGIVYKVGDDKPIADVERNYSAFPFSFIEDHPSGHHYLVCGANYQGQTVIELDTGRRRDFLPEEAKEGCGFCWADHRFDAKTQLLIVNGCYWACPYEFRFYDFSDPMEKGWPELQFEGAYDDMRWPEIGDDGFIRIYRSDPAFDDSDERVPFDQCQLAEVSKYRRHGNELRFVSTWLSQAEHERRRKRAQKQRENDAWEVEYKASDPLYLEYQRQMANPEGLSPEDYMGIGVTHEQWCPTFKGKEQRWCRRIIKGKHAIEVEWAVKTGPVKLEIFGDDNNRQDVFFEHSAEGMREAFEYAKAVEKGAPIAVTRPWVSPDPE